MESVLATASSSIQYQNNNRRMTELIYSFRSFHVISLFSLLFTMFTSSFTYFYPWCDVMWCDVRFDSHSMRNELKESASFAKQHRCDTIGWHHLSGYAVLYIILYTLCMYSQVAIYTCTVRSIRKWIQLKLVHR